MQRQNMRDVLIGAYHEQAALRQKAQSAQALDQLLRSLM